LAIEMLDLVDAAGSEERSIDDRHEARRLLRQHPGADVTEEQVAAVLRADIAARPRRGSIM
jgi:hypothetical protein